MRYARVAEWIPPPALHLHWLHGRSGPLTAAAATCCTPCPRCRHHLGSAAPDLVVLQLGRICPPVLVASVQVVLVHSAPADSPCLVFVFLRGLLEGPDGLRVLGHAHPPADRLRLGLDAQRYLSVTHFRAGAFLCVTALILVTTTHLDTSGHHGTDGHGLGVGKPVYAVFLQVTRLLDQLKSPAALPKCTRCDRPAIGPSGARLQLLQLSGACGGIQCVDAAARQHALCQVSSSPAGHRHLG